jgi:hypothetical protein
MRKGKPVSPLDDFAQGRKVLTLVGHEGVAMIARVTARLQRFLC